MASRRDRRQQKINAGGQKFMEEIIDNCHTLEDVPCKIGPLLCNLPHLSGNAISYYFNKRKREDKPKDKPKDDEDDDMKVADMKVADEDHVWSKPMVAIKRPGSARPEVLFPDDVHLEMKIGKDELPAATIRPTKNTTSYDKKHSDSKKTWYPRHRVEIPGLNGRETGITAEVTSLFIFPEFNIDIIENYEISHHRNGGSFVSRIMIIKNKDGKQLCRPHIVAAPALEVGQPSDPHAAAVPSADAFNVPASHGAVDAFAASTPTRSDLTSGSDDPSRIVRANDDMKDKQQRVAAPARSGSPLHELSAYVEIYTEEAALADKKWLVSPEGRKQECIIDGLLAEGAEPREAEQGPGIADDASIPTSSDLTGGSDEEWHAPADSPPTAEASDDIMSTDTSQDQQQPQDQHQRVAAPARSGSSSPPDELEEPRDLDDEDLASWNRLQPIAETQADRNRDDLAVHEVVSPPTQTVVVAARSPSMKEEDIQAELEALVGRSLPYVPVLFPHPGSGSQTSGTHSLWSEEDKLAVQKVCAEVGADEPQVATTTSAPTPTPSAAIAAAHSPEYREASFPQLSASPTAAQSGLSAAFGASQHQQALYDDGQDKHKHDEHRQHDDRRGTLCPEQSDDPISRDECDPFDWRSYFRPLQKRAKYVPLDPPEDDVTKEHEWRRL